MPFTLALLQMTVEGGNRRQNLSRAEQMITRAANNGADVILLPELMDLGWTHPAALTEAQPVPSGETCQLLAASARQHGVLICCGLAEKDGDKVYNTAVLFDDSGELLLKHRKINELDIGHPYYALGDRLNVCPTKWGTFGLMICADALAKNQVLSRSLALMGADVILSPCAWAVPADYDNQENPYGQLWLDAYQPVARDHSVWIAGCSSVGQLNDGPWQGRNAIGCSLLVNPLGKAVLQGPYGTGADTVLYTNIDLVPRLVQSNTRRAM